jgi:hypothetical protein
VAPAAFFSSSLAVLLLGRAARRDPAHRDVFSSKALQGSYARITPLLIFIFFKAVDYLFYICRVRLYNFAPQSTLFFHLTCGFMMLWGFFSGVLADWSLILLCRSLV